MILAGQRCRHVLSPLVPTGMLFVHNVTGVLHAPQEFVTAADVAVGVAASVKVSEDYA